MAPPSTAEDEETLVLTDDTNPIEWLQLRSVLEGEARLGEGTG